MTVPVKLLLQVQNCCRSFLAEIMSCELALDEVITEFLLKTCPLCPRSKRKHALEAAVYCITATIGTKPEYEVDTEPIPLTTGRSAEFYIEPILPHLGDIDVMFHLNTQLAIPRGHPPPTQLPAEFHNSQVIWNYWQSLTWLCVLLF